MAETSTEIRTDIERLKHRLARNADELDQRLMRMPRLARWALEHRRQLLLAHGALMLFLAARAGLRSWSSRDLGTAGD